MIRRFVPVLLSGALAVPLVPARATSAPHRHDHSHHHHAHDHGDAAPEVPRDRPRKGLVYEGLKPARESGPCDAPHHGGLFEIRRGGRLLGCTHGPDPAPAGADVRETEPAEAEPAAAEEPTTAEAISCVGDGVSGYRTQAIYAYPNTMTSRFKTYAPSIRTWASSVVDAVFDTSAAKTGGDRHVRFVTDPDTCRVEVIPLAMPTWAVDTMGGTVSFLESNGYSASNRKYLVWMDANVYCGIAELYPDDSPNQSNANNGPSWAPGMISRVDAGCWGTTSGTPVEAHELMHNLGGVQDSAPNSSYIPPGTVSPGGHCTDDFDVMCYDDDGAGPVTTTQVCTPSGTHERLFDCNDDDYFHTSPAAGSYLDTHWNTADNRFLETTDPSPPSPPTPPNDDLATASTMSGEIAAGSGSNHGAGKESGEPNHAGNAGGGSIWFRWTAPKPGWVEAGTGGSDLDTLLGVYTGDAVGALTHVASDDDVSATNLTSAVGFQAAAGTSYAIAVDGYAGDVGDVQVNLGYGTPPSGAVAGGGSGAAGPRDIDLEAKRRKVRAGKKAKLVATVESCDPGDAVKLKGRGRWTKALDQDCSVAFRVKVRRTTKYRAIDLATGLRSAKVKVRAKA